MPIKKSDLQSSLWPSCDELRGGMDASQYKDDVLLIKYVSAKTLVLWILMNPSVACTDYSDPGLRKTGKSSRFWGQGGQLVGNVHAYRATDKARLQVVTGPVVPENDRQILTIAAQAKTIVLAYGQPPKALRQRGQKLVMLLGHHEGLCYLRLSQDGTPVHPLHVPETLRALRLRPAMSVLRPTGSDP